MTCIAELDDIVKIFFFFNYFTLDFFLLCGLFQTGSVQTGRSRDCFQFEADHAEIKHRGLNLET